MLNVAMHLMLEEVDGKDRRDLVNQLTGRFRTMGDKPMSTEDLNAPAWWHGDEEAYEGMMSAMRSVPQRGRQRR